MTNPSLMFMIVRERARQIDAGARRRGPLLAQRRDRPPAPRAEPVTMRLAAAADDAQLQRLAELDSAPMPAAPLLVGERGGRPVAALSLSEGAVVADPFTPTADVIALLELRARQLGGEASGRPARRRRLAVRLLRA